MSDKDQARVASWLERTYATQMADEILGLDRYLYEGDGIEAMDLDDYDVLPEWASPWAGKVHQLFMERTGWFPLAGQRLKLCERDRFNNRYDAYEYLSEGERVVCIASSTRYWCLRVWDDTPEDLERIRLAKEARNK
jgi:hypothetical protein